MNRRNLFNFSTLELAIRIFTAFFVSIYGLAKPLQFSGGASVNEHVPLSELSGMQLMWAFFGYTLTYPILIGIIQFAGSVMLVFERTKLIASLLLTPVFMNIILLDILYDVNKGALFNAVIFQMVFIFIIVQQRKKVAQMVSTLMLDNFKFENKGERILKFVIASILGAILFFTYQFFQ